LKAATEGSLPVGVFVRLSGCVWGGLQAGGDGEVPFPWTLHPAIGVRLRRGSGGQRRELIGGRGRFAARRPVVGLAGLGGCPWFCLFLLVRVGFWRGNVSVLSPMG